MTISDYPELETLIWEGAQDGIASVSMDGKITECNPTFSKMLGYKTEELVGHLTYRDITPSKWHKLEEDILEKQVIKEGFSELYEKEYIRKDGQIFPVELRTCLMTSNEGEPVGMWAIVRDISERVKVQEDNRRLQRELQQLLRMDSLGALAAKVAHDFNNIMMIIAGHTSLLLRKVEVSNPIYRNIQRIDSAVTNASRVTKQLMQFVHQGNVELELGTINDLVKQTADSMAGMYAEASIEYHLDPGTRQIRANVNQMQSLVLNLIENAIHASLPDLDQSGPQKKVVIKVETYNQTVGEEQADKHGKIAGDYVVLKITDQGVGMRPEQVEKIFDPFYTTKSFSGGTGMGLSAVASTVKSYGGFIEVNSVATQGSSITVYFPTAKPLPGVGAGSVSFDKNKKYVLIVDDEESILNVLEEMVLDIGFEPLIAQSGAQAIDLVAQLKDSIQIVLLDMVMPGLSGKEVFEEIIQIKPDLKVVISSGYSNPAMIKAVSKDPHVVDVLMKPYNLDRLGECLRVQLKED